MKYIPVEIGKRIKENRIKLGLTQSELGEKLSKKISEQKSVHAISEYESGKTVPPLPTLFNLCEVFDCELGYLLGEENYKEKTKLKSKFLEITGLSSEVYDKLVKITEYKNKKNGWCYDISVVEVLNKLFTIIDFGNMMGNIADYEANVKEFNKIMNEINEFEDKHPESEGWGDIADPNSYARYWDKRMQDLDQAEKEVYLSKFLITESFNSMINSYCYMEEYKHPTQL